MVSFTGTYNTRHWIKTGFTSLDLACSRLDRKTQKVEMGIPTRVGIHMYANTKVGKSHTALTLAAILAEKMQKSFVFAPVDTFDSDAAEEIVNAAGLTRDPKLVLEETDEKTCDGLHAQFAKPAFAVGILDSVMAISPISEQEGDSGDANMGRRAKMTSTWVKKMFHEIKLNKEEKIFIAINHLYNNLGTTPGTYTPGGKALMGFTSLHIKLQRSYPKIGNKLGWLVEGVIDQANFIPNGRVFNLYIVGGYGIHAGLTAVFDCLMFGLATKDKSGYITLGDFRTRLSVLMDNPDNEKMFEPFLKAINTNMDTISKMFITKESKKKESKKTAKENLKAVAVVADEPDDDDELDTVSDEEVTDDDIAQVMG